MSLLVTLRTVLWTSLFVVACGDTGSDSLGTASSGGATTSSGGGSSSGDNTSSSSGGSSSGGSSSGGGVDAGADTGSNPVVDAGSGPFQGAPAFVNQIGRDARDTMHNFAGNTPVQNPSKQHCLDCHAQANFGGTLFRDAAGTMPLANAEVVVQAPGGPRVIVHTDQDGNFIVFGNAPVKAKFPANTAARTATAVRAMSGMIANGNCNKCHDGTTTSFIYVN